MFIIWWRTKQTDSVFPGQNFEVTCILVILSYCPVLCFFFFSKLLRTRTAEFLRLEANYMLEHHFQEIADIFRKCRQSGQCSCGSEVKGSGRLTPGCPSDKQDKWTLSQPKTSTRTVCFLLLQVSVWVHFGIMSVNHERFLLAASVRVVRVVWVALKNSLWISLIRSQSSDMMILRKVLELDRTSLFPDFLRGFMGFYFAVDIW